MNRKGKNKAKAKGSGKSKSKFNDPTYDPAFDMNFDEFPIPAYDPPPWAREIDELELNKLHRMFMTGEEIVTVEVAIKAADDARFAISTKAIAATGIEPAVEALAEGKKLRVDEEEENIEGEEYPQAKGKDFFARISSSPELVIELIKYMDPSSLLSLYCIHKHVNGIINGHLTHTMKLCADYQAPEAARIYSFTLYESLCVRDPVGRPHPTNPDKVRMVPSIRWLQMIIHREKTVRDILACLARQGHRMPPEMNLTLKKMWFVMDIATSARRAQVMHSTDYFTALDIFHIQMFVVKLDMRFNDPIDGPGEDHLRKLMLGQRGLTPLCKLLKRTAYTEMADIVRAAVRYDWDVKPEHRHYPILGVPPEEIGTGHLEGWGKGRVHLYRPDELVVREAVRRRLDLKNHIMGMMLWGYVDPVTGEDTPATEDEMYMSDDGREDRPKNPLWQDHEWLEIEPKVYEETEELKESNDWAYAQKKGAEREEAKRVEDIRKAEEAKRAKEEWNARRAEELKRDAEEWNARRAEGLERDEEDMRDEEPNDVASEWREGMSKEEERAWKEKMRNSGPNTGLGSVQTGTNQWSSSESSNRHDNSRGDGEESDM
ncbi:hypothetical protein IFR05_011704 [Cadophora sp. M221]|nr:hypothetical protein IFR05_011704 [Cadophora sp. M221]